MQVLHKIVLADVSTYIDIKPFANLKQRMRNWCRYQRPTKNPRMSIFPPFPFKSTLSRVAHQRLLRENSHASPDRHFWSASASQQLPGLSKFVGVVAHFPRKYPTPRAFRPSSPNFCRRLYSFVLATDWSEGPCRGVGLRGRRLGGGPPPLSEAHVCATDGNEAKEAGAGLG